MPFPLSADRIAAAEKALGARLPEAYRAAMARSNGGEVEAKDDVWQLHPLEDNSDRRRIARTANHVGRETDVARTWPRFPSDAIAIASNGTGDLLVLRRRAESFEDTVYLWSHERGTLTEIASSIEVLLVK